MSTPNFAVFKPWDTLVLIQPDKPNTVTAGGIIIPEASIVEQAKGKISAVGSKVTAIKEDQRVLYNLHSSIPIEYEGVRYVLVKEKDVSAIIDEA